MSNTQTTPKATTNPDVAAGTAQFLTPVVIELEALVVNGKQAHWNLRGSNFIGVHELLDTLVADAQEWADLAAERIVALGLPIDARIATVAANTKASPLSDGFVQSDKSIDSVVTLGAPFADTAAKARSQSGSSAEIDTFDLNPQVATSLKNGTIGFAVDQQPYLQGYEAVDLLWLYRYNKDTLGGGQAVLTGPQIVTKDDADALLSYAKRGTR